MSILDRFRKPEAKAARMPDVPKLPVVEGYQRWGWNDLTFDRINTEAVRSNAAVAACLLALTFKYNEPGIGVIDRNGEPQPDHPLQALLDRPNPLMSHSELMLYVINYKAVGGNCYLHKVRNRAGQCIQLWPYHSGLMRPVPSKTAWIAEYEYCPEGTLTPGSDRVRIPASEVIHLKWPLVDLSQPWLAQAPLLAAAREVDTDTEMTRYLYALLMNDAVVRTVLTMPAGSKLNDSQFERLRQQWQGRHGGVNRGGVGIVEGGATISRMALNMQELSMEALRRIPESRIAAAFRVPALLAGLYVGLEKSTYSNFQEARKQLTEDTFVPLWKSDAIEYTQALATAEEYGDDVTVRYDVGKVAALQEAETDKYTRILAAYDGQVVTKNEARAYLGYQKVGEIQATDEGDTFKTTPVPVVPAQPIIDVEPVPPKMLTDSTAAAKAIYHAVVADMKARATGPMEKRIERDLDAYFSGQYEDWAVAGGSE